MNNLSQAIRYAPDDVRLRVDLAQAHLDAYDQRLRMLKDCWGFATITQIIMAPTMNRGDMTFPALQTALNYRLVGMFSAEQFFPAATEAATREHLYPALRQFALARDLCPLLAQPQLMLANYRPRFQKADPRRAYLDRAQMLVTNDPVLYFLFGLEYFLEGEVDSAAASWRRSLELGKNEMPAIFEVTKSFAGKRELYDRILPDDPRILLSAGEIFDSYEPFRGSRTPDLGAGAASCPGKRVLPRGRRPGTSSAHSAASQAKSRGGDRVPGCPRAGSPAGGVAIRVGAAARRGETICRGPARIATHSRLEARPRGSDGTPATGGRRDCKDEIKFGY